MKKIVCIFIMVLLTACQPQDNTIHGYVEGEFLMISPTSEGLLKTLSVERGQTIKAGAPLFALDTTELTAQRENAAANIRRAKAQLGDLLKGERPEEIEVILKQKEQAQAMLENAQKEYNRIIPLAQSGSASASSRDVAKATLGNSRARVAELNAQLKKANLGARIDQIEEAKAAVEAAEKLMVQWDKKIADAAPMALVGGLINDTYFRPGEFVATGKPVVSLLPPGNVKIRFYLPQSIIPKLKMGQGITVSCDGCSVPMKAKIVYIAPHAEYTPPVIYSVESRQKLMFLVEAKPDQFTEILRPGLPVDVKLTP